MCVWGGGGGACVSVCARDCVWCVCACDCVGGVSVCCVHVTVCEVGRYMYE